MESEMIVAHEHDTVVIRNYLKSKLAHVREAQRQLDLAYDDALARRQRGKAEGHRKRALYWKNIASGILWMMRTLPKS